MSCCPPRALCMMKGTDFAMAIHESGEDYLESILILKNERGYVRSIDVAGFLGVTKPSVSRAMSILKAEGYIEVGRDGSLELTESGLSVAESMYERHQLIADYFVAIGVGRETAVQDACRIEHVISDESFARLREHAQTYISELKE